MSRIHLLFFTLFLAFTFTAASTLVFATDLKSPHQAYPDGRSQSGDAQSERDLAQFCYTQGHICGKICDLRSNFEDKFDGCPQSCESRAIRCTQTGCFRWKEPDFLIAERFGGLKCAL